MSAAPVLPSVYAAALPKALMEKVGTRPIETLAFYRKHTESLLRQYFSNSLIDAQVAALLRPYIANRLG
jgi:hypothetical protein